MFYNSVKGYSNEGYIDDAISVVEKKPDEMMKNIPIQYQKNKGNLKTTIT